MAYLGDYVEDYPTLNFDFTTRTTTGVPTALAGGVLSIYPAGSIVQITAGITLTASLDGVVGLNHVLVDLSADALYVVAKDYSVVITTGTVGGVSVVGEVVGLFSIQNRYMRGTDSAYTGTPPTVGQIRTEMEAAGTKLTQVHAVIPATAPPTNTQFEARTLAAASYATAAAIAALNNLSQGQAQTACTNALTAYAGALEATLTAMKGAGWSNETLKAIKDAITTVNTTIAALSHTVTFTHHSSRST